MTNHYNRKIGILLFLCISSGLVKCLKVSADEASNSMLPSAFSLRQTRFTKPPGLGEKQKKMISNDFFYQTLCQHLQELLNNSRNFSGSSLTLAQYNIFLKSLEGTKKSDNTRFVPNLMPLSHHPSQQTGKLSNHTLKILARIPPPIKHIRYLYQKQNKPCQKNEEEKQEEFDPVSIPIQLLSKKNKISDSDKLEE